MEFEASSSKQGDSIKVVVGHTAGSGAVGAAMGVAVTKLIGGIEIVDQKECDSWLTEERYETSEYGDIWSQSKVEACHYTSHGFESYADNSFGGDVLIILTFTISTISLWFLSRTIILGKRIFFLPQRRNRGSPPRAST